MRVAATARRFPIRLGFSVVRCLAVQCGVFAVVARARLIPRARAVLDCRHSPRWSVFLDAVLANRDRGYPVDIDLAMQAFELFMQDVGLYTARKHKELSQNTCASWEYLVEDMCMDVPRSNESHEFTERPCFYGDLNARWVFARHLDVLGWSSEGYNMCQLFDPPLLARSIFQLYQYYSDWSEESSWPISPFDILASAGRCCLPEAHSKGIIACDATSASMWEILSDSDLISPGFIPKLPRWSQPLVMWHDILDKRSRVHRPLSLLPPRETPHVLQVWELGIHKTLSAEVLTALHRATRANNGHCLARNLVTHQYPTLMARCPLYANAKMSCHDDHDIVNEIVDAAIISRLAWRRDATTGRDVEYKESLGWQDWETLGSNLAAALPPMMLSVDLFVVTQPIAFLIAVKTNSALQTIPTLLYMSSVWTYMLHVEAHARFKDLFVAEANRPGNMFVSQFAWQWQGIRSALKVDALVQGGLSLYTGIRPKAVPSRGLLVLSRDSPRDMLMVCLFTRRNGELSPAQRLKDIEFATWELRRSWAEMSAFQAAAIFPYSSFTLTFEELYNMAVPILIPRRLSKHLYGASHTIGRGGPRAFQLRFQSLSLFETFCRPMVLHFDSLAELLRLAGPGPIAAGKLMVVRQTAAVWVTGLQRKGLNFWKAALLPLLPSPSTSLLS
mmetsp:Transcript_80801/g.262008  ORF Transcript_80801/g.262008 Transcript_80801/m.262008 type:complete len:674 (+) Transcript_80801:203-2224(+)